MTRQGLLRRLQLINGSERLSRLRALLRAGRSVVTHPDEPTPPIRPTAH